MCFVNKKSRENLIATLSGPRVLQWFIEHSLSYISACSDSERHGQTQQKSNAITRTLEKWKGKVSKNARAEVEDKV